MFVASTHPLVRYISSHWKRLVPVDTSGGNVTHAAVSLALELGARHVEVYGADFCYPDGKAYARGTYMYDLFRADQSRVSPAEARFFSFAQGSTQSRRSVVGARVLYTTPLMSGYRERFIELMASTDAQIVAVPGKGLDIPPQMSRASPRAAPELESRGPARLWKEFLSEYGRGIEHVPPLAASSRADEKMLWGTILPVAACVVREGTDPGQRALEEARRWTVERISRAVQALDEAPAS